MGRDLAESSFDSRCGISCIKKEWLFPVAMDSARTLGSSAMMATTMPVTAAAGVVWRPALSAPGEALHSRTGRGSANSAKDVLESPSFLACACAKVHLGSCLGGEHHHPFVDRPEALETASGRDV